MSYATAGAGGVAIMGSDKGVTVWRPQPPVGYAVLGDVLSAGEYHGRWKCALPGCPAGVVRYYSIACGSTRSPTSSSTDKHTLHALNCMSGLPGGSAAVWNTTEQQSRTHIGYAIHPWHAC